MSDDLEKVLVTGLWRMLEKTEGGMMAFKPRDDRTKRERLKDKATNRDQSMSDHDFEVTLDQMLEEAWAEGWGKRDSDRHSHSTYDNPYNPKFY